MTLTLNTVNSMFKKILWLLMIYQQTKFGCDRLLISEDVVQIVVC